MHDASEIVPITEAVRLLNMGRDPIVRRIASGQLEGGQTLGRWFVTRAAIDKELERRRHTGGEMAATGS
jgi:hypothetical protein